MMSYIRYQKWELICRETIEHVSDPDNLLECCKHITYPEPFLFISCPYTNSSVCFKRVSLKVLSSDQLTVLVQRHGFKVLETFVDRESNVIIAQKIKNE